MNFFLSLKKQERYNSIQNKQRHINQNAQGNALILSNDG